MWEIQNITERIADFFFSSFPDPLMIICYLVVLNNEIVSNATATLWTLIIIMICAANYNTSLPLTHLTENSRFKHDTTCLPAGGFAA